MTDYESVKANSVCILLFNKSFTLVASGSVSKALNLKVKGYGFDAQYCRKFSFFHFFLLHDKKAAKLVVLRRNFKVSKIDLAPWSIDFVLPLRLFFLYRAVSQREGGRKEI